MLLLCTYVGGHPRNWNRICDSCLDLVNEFVAALNATSQIRPQQTAVTSNVDDYRSHTPHLRLRQQQQQHSATAVTSSTSKKPLESSLIQRILSALWSKLSRNSLFTPLPDSATRAVFARAQLVIWAVEGELSWRYTSSKECLYSISPFGRSLARHRCIGVRR